MFQQPAKSRYWRPRFHLPTVPPHHLQSIYYCTLGGRIKGATSAISVIQHSLRAGTRNTARYVITVIVLALLTKENKAGKVQSTINQLKHEKGRAVRNNGTRGVFSIDQYSTRLRHVLYSN